MTCSTRGSWGIERDKTPLDIDLPLIKIPRNSGLSLIVKLPTGCAYLNQTGGHFCHQSWAEGLLVLLKTPCEFTMAGRLRGVFTGESKYGGYCGDGIDEEDAQEIDSLLRESIRGYSKSEPALSVDRERLADSWEAWVHVVIGKHPERPTKPQQWENPGWPYYWPYYGLPAELAILTWTNSSECEEDTSRGY
ncbi:DUF6210 family protein [Myxococcota bacterium]